MWASYAIGVGAVMLVALAWAGVQLAWKRAFPDVGGDPDALARRMGCGGCSCTTVCERRAAEAEEESR